jgi:hypothetical protein
LQSVTVKTNSYTINKAESSEIFTNSGAAGGFIFTLPTASEGLFFEFYVTTAKNIRITPQAGDVLRGYDGITQTTLGAGKYTQSTTLLSKIKIKCVIAGYWEFERLGTWTDES